MLRTTTIAIAATLATLATAPAIAQNTSGSSGNFVTQSARRGLAIAELSEVALQRSQNPEVRKLARRMHDSQLKGYDDLLAVAGQAGLETPDSIDLEQRGIKARLTGLSGTTFDREYLQAIRTNQDRAIALLRSYGKTGEDQGLKDWANQQLPTLRRDQQLAESVARDLPRS
jgi:putative membrane protein